MNQLTLDLGPAPAQDFRNFVVGANELCVQSLVSMVDAVREHRTPSPRIFYVWGPTGTGKSHLATALALRGASAVCAHPTRRPGSRTTAATSSAATAAAGAPNADPPCLYVIDDVDRLPRDAQLAWLDRFHEVQRRPGDALVAFGPVPPVDLDLLPDLRSRLAWELVMPLHRLAERDVRRAIIRAFDRRAIEPDDPVIDHLMHHAQRDIASLNAIIAHLAAVSLQHKRRVTVPLLRQLLADPAAFASAFSLPPPSGPPPSGVIEPSTHAATVTGGDDALADPNLDLPLDAPDPNTAQDR